MTFLAIDPSPGVRSGTTSATSSSSRLGALQILALIDVNNVVELGLELNFCVLTDGVVKCDIFDNGDRATSSTWADPTDRLAIDGDSVLASSNDGTAHLGWIRLRM